MESVLRVKLPPEANEEDLSALFSGYSHSVSKVVIERGYGMVYLTSKAVAEEALARLDGTEMLGSKIQVCFHRDTVCGLWVGSLPLNVTEKDLQDHFSSFAPSIVNVKVNKDAKKDGKFGFVNFSNKEALEKAHAALNKSFLSGKQIVTNIQASSSTTRNLAKSKLSYPETFTVKVWQLPPGLTEEEIREKANVFGRVFHVKHFKAKGYAYINYLDKTEAQVAAAGLTEFGGKPISAQFQQAGLGSSSKDTSRLQGQQHQHQTTRHDAHFTYPRTQVFTQQDRPSLADPRMAQGFHVRPQPTAQDFYTQRQAQASSMQARSSFGLSQAGQQNSNLRIPLNSSQYNFAVKAYEKDIEKCRGHEIIVDYDSHHQILILEAPKREAQRMKMLAHTLGSVKEQIFELTTQQINHLTSQSRGTSPYQDFYKSWYVNDDVNIIFQREDRRVCFVGKEEVVQKAIAHLQPFLSAAQAPLKRTFPLQKNCAEALLGNIPLREKLQVLRVSLAGLHKNSEEITIESESSEQLEEASKFLTDVLSRYDERNIELSKYAILSAKRRIQADTMAVVFLEKQRELPQGKKLVTLAGFDPSSVQRAFEILSARPFESKVPCSGESFTLLNKDGRLPKIRKGHAVSVSPRLTHDGMILITSYVREDLDAAVEEFRQCLIGEICEEELRCSTTERDYVVEVLDRNPRQELVDIKDSVALSNSVGITLKSSSLSFKGAASNVQSARKEFRERMFKDFKCVKESVNGYKVVEQFVSGAIVKPIQSKFPNLVVAAALERRRRISEGPTTSASQRFPSEVVVTILGVKESGVLEAEEILKAELKRVSSRSLRLLKSETDCLSRARNQEKILLQLATECGLACNLFRLRTGFIDLAFSNPESYDKFRRQLHSYFDLIVDKTEEKPMSVREYRFLEVCKKKELEKLKHEECVEIFFKKSKDEQQVHAIVRGKRGQVSKASQQLDEFLEGLTSKTFHVEYPVKAFNVIRTKFYSIRDELKETAELFIDIGRPDKLLQLPKNVNATSFEVVGLQAEEIADAKEKFCALPNLLDQFSKEISVPFQLLKKLQDREKRQEMEKMLSVGLYVEKNCVHVYAFSSEDVEMAESELNALAKEQESDSTVFQCGNECIGGILCTKMWTKVIQCAKEEGVFVRRAGDNFSLFLKGEKSKVSRMRSVLDSLEAEVKRGLVEDTIQLSDQQSKLLSNERFLAQMRKLQREFSVQVTWPGIQKAVILKEIKIGAKTLILSRNNIAEEDVDVIVNAANEDLIPGAGVAGAISKLGGPAIATDAANYVRTNGRVRPGNAVALPGHNLKCKYVVHAVAPKWTEGGLCEKGTLRQAVRNSLLQAAAVGARSVAIPALGTGVFRFPVDECASITFDVIRSYFSETASSSIQSIRVVVYDRASKDAFLKDANSFASTLQPKQYEWKYFGDGDQFLPYDVESSQAIESAFQSDPSSQMQREIKSFKYLIDLQQMMQTNISTGKRRQILRSESDAAALPYRWCFEDDSRMFQWYDAMSSKQIESTYQLRTAKAVPIQVNSVHYLIDFEKMTQTNTLTNRERKIRREIQQSASSSDIEHSEAEAGPVLLTACGQRRDVTSAKSKLLHLINSSFGEKKLAFPKDAVKALKDEIKEIVAKSDLLLKADFDAETTAIELKIEGLKQNLEKVVNELQEMIIDYQSSRKKEQEPSFPDEWEEQGDVVELKSVSLGSPEAIRVEARMKETISSVKIEKLHRIQNQWLWEQYDSHKRRMFRKNDGKINEQELFHGTRRTDPKLIYEGEEGFDMRYSNAGMWGQGNYFAVNASYSNGYAYSLGGAKQMFLVKVLTGDWIEMASNSSLRKPPMKPAGTGINYGYDSVKGFTGGSTVYITYKNDKTYPFYLITYRC